MTCIKNIYIFDYLLFKLSISYNYVDFYMIMIKSELNDINFLIDINISLLIQGTTGDVRCTEVIIDCRMIYNNQMLYSMVILLSILYMVVRRRNLVEKK